MTGKIAVGGITRSNELVLVRVLGARPAPGMAGQTLSTLGNQRINLICVTSFVDTAGRDNIGFAIHQRDLDQALGLLQTIKDDIEAEAIEVRRHCCSISIYGPHFSERPAIAGRVFAATAQADIDIHMIATSFATVSFLIDEDDGDLAVAQLHEIFLVP